MGKFTVVTSNDPDPIPEGRSFRVISAPPEDSSYASKEDLSDLESRVITKADLSPLTSSNVDFCIFIDGGNASSSNCSGY